jgi:FtsP/CotA-like multicopper oxidase with cupredoxin domain
LRAGTEYRFRFINISDGTTADISLSDGARNLSWHALAKDGAMLPAAMQREVEAKFRTQAGETYDFTWRPSEPMRIDLVVDNNFGRFITDPGRLVLNQPVRVVRSTTQAD